MKKEILIAILIGFILGLIITFGIWTANKSLKASLQEAKPTPEETGISVVKEGQEEKLLLTISDPENNSISDKEKITIFGETSPLAIVSVIYQEGEEITEADEEGKFEVEISLVGGTNEIQISAYDDQSNEAGKILNIIYSTAKI